MRTSTVTMSLTSQLEERHLCQATIQRAGVSQAHARSSPGRPHTQSMLKKTTRDAYAKSGAVERPRAHRRLEHSAIEKLR